MYWHSSCSCAVVVGIIERDRLNSHRMYQRVHIHQGGWARGCGVNLRSARNSLSRLSHATIETSFINRKKYSAQGKSSLPAKGHPLFNAISRKIAFHTLLPMLLRALDVCSRRGVTCQHNDRSWRSSKRLLVDIGDEIINRWVQCVILRKFAYWVYWLWSIDKNCGNFKSKNFFCPAWKWFLFLNWLNLSSFDSFALSMHEWFCSIERENEHIELIENKGPTAWTQSALCELRFRVYFVIECLQTQREASKRGNSASGPRLTRPGAILVQLVAQP
jgi:hypothetical protein